MFSMCCRRFRRAMLCTRGGKRAGGRFSILGVTDCTLSGNSAVNGGAIYNGSGMLEVNRSTLSSNSAQSDGGAIFNNGGTLTLTANTFTDNTPDDVS